MKLHNARENTYRYLTSKEIEQEFLRYKTKLAWKEFERSQQTLEEYRQKYFCEFSPFEQHDFRRYQPSLGTVSLVCRFCAAESDSMLLRPSVYAYKGKRFGSDKKSKR